MRDGPRSPVRVPCEVEAIDENFLKVKWHPSWRDKVQTASEFAIPFDPHAIYDGRVSRDWFENGAWCKRYYEIGDRCKIKAQKTNDDRLLGFFDEVNHCDAQVIRWDYVFNITRVRPQPGNVAIVVQLNPPGKPHGLKLMWLPSHHLEQIDIQFLKINDLEDWFPDIVAVPTGRRLKKVPRARGTISVNTQKQA